LRMPTRSDGCVLPSTVPPQEVCTETHQDKGRTSKRATHSGAWRSCRARDAPALRRRPSTGWRWLSQNAEDRAQALKLCSGRPVNRLCGGAASVGREQFEVWCGVDRNRASGKVGRPTTHPIHIGSTATGRRHDFASDRPPPVPPRPSPVGAHNYGQRQRSTPLAHPLQRSRDGTAGACRSTPSKIDNRSLVGRCLPLPDLGGDVLRTAAGLVKAFTTADVEAINVLGKHVEDPVL
jgi:hypothetical protein